MLLSDVRSGSNFSSLVKSCLACSYLRWFCIPNLQVLFLIILISPIHQVYILAAFYSSRPKLYPALLCTAACKTTASRIFFFHGSLTPIFFLFHPIAGAAQRAMSSGMANEIKLLSGSSHTELSNKVANRSVSSLVTCNSDGQQLM
jgi:hypothetical protein